MRGLGVSEQQREEVEAANATERETNAGILLNGSSRLSFGATRCHPRPEGTCKPCKHRISENVSDNDPIRFV